MVGLNRQAGYVAIREGGRLHKGKDTHFGGSIN